MRLRRCAELVFPGLQTSSFPFVRLLGSSTCLLCSHERHSLSERGRSSKEVSGRSKPETSSAPEAPGEQQGEEALNPNCSSRELHTDCISEPAQMDEANRTDANADREYTQHAAAQLRRRG